MNIKAPTRALQGAGAGMKRLATVVGRGETRLDRTRWDGTGARPQPLDRYVISVSQSLAVLRFVSFAMGAALVFALNAGDRQPLVLGPMVLVVGLFNVYRILWRFDPGQPSGATPRVSLVIDTALSISLTLMSGGLDSPFLIYSLSPILTASLLMNLRIALAAAGISALWISGGHVLAGLGVSNLPEVLSENYLVLALLYAAMCLLVVGLPFLANLNWQRRVRFESLAEERHRLRREVHDNVAQTLAFLSLKMKLAEQRAAQGKSPITERDVGEIGSIVERTYLAVRDYLDGTDEQSDDPLRLRLPAIADQWSRDTGLPVNTSVTGEEGDLPVEVKFQLVQVTREALANVAKHAYPEHVWLELSCEPEEILIRIKDDGRGFVTSGLKGHGMGIMDERTAMAGASLDIHSTPGHGTEVVVTYARGANQGDT